MYNYDPTRFSERDAPEDYGSYRAMNYGSMPPSLLTSKFEETDIGDEEDRYDNYARSNLVDWGPDTCTFEHEKPRGGVNARSGRLQAQYYGHRGDADIPYQPERFDGFMGPGDRDPRGTATEPDMKELRKQHEARTRFIRWTPDGADHVTGGGRSEMQVMADQQTLFKIVKNRLKVFDWSRDGRREGLRRTYAHKSDVSKQVRVQSYGDLIKNHALTPQRRAAIICREVIRGSRAWCDETADGDFAMAKYTQHRRQRRGDITQARILEGADTAVRPDATDAVTAARKTCGILMANIVRGKAQAAATPSDIDFATARETAARKTEPMTRDLTQILRSIGQDAEFAAGKITMRGKTAGQQRAEHLATAQDHSHASLPAHHYLNAEILYKSVRPGADTRKVKNYVVRDAHAADTMAHSGIAKAARRRLVTGAKLNRAEDADRGDSSRAYSYRTGVVKIGPRVRGAADQTDTDAPETQIRRINKTGHRGPRSADTVENMKYGNNASGERHGGILGSKYLWAKADRDSASVDMSDV